jgi:protein MpaA
MTKHQSSSRLVWAVGSIWLLAGLLVGLIALLLVLYVFMPNQSPSQIDDTPAIISTTVPPPSETPIPPTPVPPTDTPTQEPSTPTATETNIPSPTSTPTFVNFYEGPTVIGYSVQGRPLEVYRFGRGPNAYLALAGIHGGYEMNTVALADEIIQYLAVRPNLIPEDATLYVLRVLNPDGLEFEHEKEGRANFNGVDLNRNYPVLWQETWPKTGCWDLLDLSAGPYAASEPETIALMAFILEHPIVALVSFHAAAPGIYPAGKPPYNDSDRLARQLSLASGYPYPAFATGCKMTGSLVDWVATTGAAAVDVELSNHWDTDFEINLKLIMELVTWKP